MNPLRVALFSLLLAVAPLFAEEAKPAQQFKTTVSAIELKDGDTLVFLGDSITHQCLYTQYIEDYFYTRFPAARIKFHNSGVGGDRASDAIARFDDDVAAFKPKFVTILLGMNDGGYKHFDAQTFDAYEKGMTTVLDRIAAIGATAVPITPTMLDSRAAEIRSGKRGVRENYYNAVLAFYGAWLREQASVRGLGFVDMYGPLNKLTIEQRKKDAKFTMIPDAVHPGPAGQVVMATAILEDMIQRGPVSGITIREQKTGKYAPFASNGKVTELQADNTRISFNFKANALPWVLPPDAAEGYKLVHAGHRNSNEKITVGNLQPGKYELRIDGTVVGTYTDGQLAFGVELEENSKTPQYQQALAVAMLNKDRNDKAMRPLRDLWGQLKKQRREIAKLENAKDPSLPAKRAAFEKWQADFKPSVDRQLALCKEFEDKIYAANQPSVRKYELTRLP